MKSHNTSCCSGKEELHVGLAYQRALFRRVCPAYVLIIEHAERVGVLNDEPFAMLLALHRRESVTRVERALPALLNARVKMASFTSAGRSAGKLSLLAFAFFTRVPWTSRCRLLSGAPLAVTAACSRTLAAPFAGLICRGSCRLVIAVKV